MIRCCGVGIRPADIQYASIYDSFTVTVLMQLEDLGFCAKGAGGRLVADGNLIAGVGRLPVNTDGGGLCNNHPANRGGITKVFDAVRQLRGTAHQAVLKRLIVLDRSFDSVFTRRSIGCEALLADLKTWFAAIADEQPLSKTGVRSCLALATLDLVITCQLASPQMLKDVLQKKNFRLVLLADKAYLEYHPLLNEHASAPVTRYRIVIGGPGFWQCDQKCAQVLIGVDTIGFASIPQRIQIGGGICPSHRVT